MITRADRLQAKVAGLAGRSRARWLAVTLDGQWITAAGWEPDPEEMWPAGDGALVWRSADDQFGFGRDGVAASRHLLVADW